MRVGTKSILFGVHQFIWHPWTVTLAWKSLYGRWPNAWQLVAIFCHDLAYWGCNSIDGPDGTQHPLGGARLTRKIVRLFAPERAEQAYELALYHSRFFAAQEGREPSALCWADKYSVWFDPWGAYLVRAHLSGEIREYIKNAPKWVQGSSLHWHAWYRNRVLDVVARRLPAEPRAKISAAKTGVKRSPEARAAIRAGIKAAQLRRAAGKL